MQHFPILSMFFVLSNQTESLLEVFIVIIIFIYKCNDAFLKALIKIPPPGPLATLAGVYQDVRGQRPEAVWKEVVTLWTEWLGAVVPALLGNTQLRPLAQAGFSTLGVAMDLVRNPYSSES